MGATFPRVKNWIAEILNHADLNAEIDNILTNLTPAGVDDYSLNTAQMQIMTSPIDAAAAPVLATSLSGEIARLRYQIQQIMGSTTTYWYQQPTATLSSLANIVFGNSVPATRIDSIGSAGYANRLVADGASAKVTLKGTAGTITYYIQGVQYTLSTDVSISGMSTAVTSNNTAIFSDSNYSAAVSSQLLTEHGTVMLVGTVGSAITALANTIQAYKVVHSATAEYFWAEYVNDATFGTLFRKGRRGNFFDSTNTAVPRLTISNSDVVTLMKMAWIFLKTDGTLTLTYNVPTYQATVPASATIGDYCFDFSTTTWKLYGSLGWAESGAVYIGQAVMDGTNCVAARSVEPYKVYQATNTVDLTTKAATAATLYNLTPNATLSVYGKVFNFGFSNQTWTASNLVPAGALASAATYYVYVKDTGVPVLSTLAPHDRRTDLGGFYYPTESWRCVGYVDTSSSVFTETSIKYFSSDKETSFWPRKMVISASSGTFQATGTTSYGTVTNLSITYKSSGKPVKLELISDGTGTVASFGINSAIQTVLVIGNYQFIRGSTSLGQVQLALEATPSTGPVFNLTLPPPYMTDTYGLPGIYTYAFQVKSNASNGFFVNQFLLTAYEIGIS